MTQQLPTPTTTTTTTFDSPEVVVTSTQQENGTPEGPPNTAQNRVDPTFLTLTSGDNVSANDANDDEEAPATSPSDNADYPATRARAIVASSERLPEFGSRSNYQEPSASHDSFHLSIGFCQKRSSSSSAIFLEDALEHDDEGSHKKAAVTEAME